MVKFYFEKSVKPGKYSLEIRYANANGAGQLSVTDGKRTTNSKNRASFYRWGSDMENYNHKKM